MSTHVFRNPAFRNLWAAGLLSMTGSEMSRLALVLYLFNERHSVFDVALLVALRALPGALAAPGAGFLIDRYSRRTMMIGADVARMALTGVMLASPTPAAIYFAAIFDSVATAVFEPARCALLPSVTRRDEVPAANGVQQATANLTMVVGPVLGAEVFLLGGLHAVLVIDGASYLLSALLLISVRPRHPSCVAASSGSPLEEIREGWRYCRREAIVLCLVTMIFVSMLCGGIWMPLAPFFVHDVMGASDRALGLQFSAFGLGGIAGGLVASAIAARVHTGFLLFNGLLAEAALFVIYALVPNVAASVVVLFFWGITVSLIAVASQSILQLTVADRLLGRVFSTLKQGENLAMLLAMGLAVALSAWLSIRVVFLLAGGSYFAIVAAASMTKGGRALLTDVVFTGGRADARGRTRRRALRARPSPGPRAETTPAAGPSST